MATSVTDVFVIVQIICGILYATQLVDNSFKWTALARRRSARLLRILPITNIFLSLLLLFITLKLKHDAASECAAEPESMNADIGGIGVILGFTIPSIDLLVVLSTGHFKSEPSGAKELCIAQFANLVYLSVNLVKSTRTLNLREALVACSSIDAVSASISMAFSDKEVLAARKLVKYAHLAQLVALGVQIWTFSRIQDFKSSICSIEGLHPFIHSNSAMPLTYLIVRLLGLLVPAPAIWQLSERFNELQHEADKHILVRDALLWVIHPATVTTSYLMFSSIAILHTAILWTIVQGSSNQTWQALWTEWGQSTSFILACYATTHVIYTFIKICEEKATLRRGKIAFELHGRHMRSTTPHRKQNLFVKLNWSLPFGKHFLGSPDQVLLDTTTEKTYTELQSSSYRRDEEGPVAVNERELAREDLLKAFDPLHRDRDLIRDALKRGAPLDEPYPEHNNDYPLHMAAYWGNLEVVNDTMPEDSDCSAALLSQNSDRLTPLMISLRASNMEAFKRILERLVKCGQRGSDAIQKVYRFAVITERRQYLQEIGSKWPGHIVLDAFMIDRALKRGFVQEILQSGTSPSDVCLRAAYTRQHEAMTFVLRTRSQDIDPRALDFALMQFAEDNTIATALKANGAKTWANFFQYLNERKPADLQRLISESRQDGTTARMINAYNKDLSESTLLTLLRGESGWRNTQRCLELLLKAGASPTQPDDIGNTALMECAQYHPAEIFILLLDYTDQEDIHKLNRRGQTLMHKVCEKFRPHVDSPRKLCALLRKGFDPTAKDPNGRSSIDLIPSEAEDEWASSFCQRTIDFLKRYEQRPGILTQYANPAMRIARCGSIRWSKCSNMNGSDGENLS